MNNPYKIINQAPICLQPGVPMEIALNAESKRKTAVAVALRDGGERSFGSDALNICVRYPKSWQAREMLE